MPIQITKEDGKTVFVTTVNGQSYKTTLGADNRPEKVEATIAMPREEAMVCLQTEARSDTNVTRGPITPRALGTT